MVKINVRRQSGLLVMAMLVITIAGCGSSNQGSTAAAVTPAAVIGQWQMISDNSVDMTSSKITVGVDNSTYTLSVPVSGTNAGTTCAEYGTWVMSGNNITITPLAGSTCGSSASTSAIALSGTTMTMSDVTDVQVYKKQTATPITSASLTGTWTLMATDRQGTVTATNSQNTAITFTATAFSYVDPTCTENGTWSLNSSGITLIPASGSSCSNAPQTEALSWNDPLLTLLDTAGDSIWKKTAGPANTAPAALAAVGVSSGVSLQWQPVAGASGYNVYRGPTSGTLSSKQLVATVASGAYSDATAQAGTTYYYEITALTNTGETPASNEVSVAAVTNSSQSQVPSPVIGLTATAGNASALLSWNAVTGATAYNIYAVDVAAGTIVPYFAKSIATTPSSYSIKGSNSLWKLITTVNAPQHSQTLSSLNNGDTYLYIVTAVNGTGESLATTYVTTVPVAPVAAKWKVLTSTVKTNLWGITAGEDAGGNPLFVAVGGGTTSGTFFSTDQAAILTSPDGVNWTSVTSTGSALIRVIWTDWYYEGNITGGTYVNPQYVAVGNGGEIMTSADGQKWTTVTSGTTHTLWGIAWSSSLTMYVAVGNTGTILTSPDGVTWTVQNSGTTQNLRHVKALGAGFIASGWNGTLLSSSDGVHWTPQTTGISYTLEGVGYNGVTYVAVGGGGSILTSQDTVTWTTQQSGITTMLEDVAWNGKQWIAVGYGGVALTSLDGLTWVNQTSNTPNDLYSLDVDSGFTGLPELAVGAGGTIVETGLFGQ